MILLALGAISAFTDIALAEPGEQNYATVLIIAVMVFISGALRFVQETRSGNVAEKLIGMLHTTACVERAGEKAELPLEEIVVGDLVHLSAGDMIPADLRILSAKDLFLSQSALTGESIPVDKAAGDPVSAATANQSGFLRCQATRVGEDTTLSQIIQMVSDAAATKAPIAKVADRVSGVFVPAVITIAVLTAAGWLLAGETAGFALARGISVLVISCPCALGLATPVAIMVGSGVGARNGIMFKTAVSLEETGKVEIVALDKTGTITAASRR
mgnify:CR=1 FL=1